MRFLDVELRDFRNITEVFLDFSDPSTGQPLPVAVLVGPNGSGKTAVLDAMQRLSYPFAWDAAAEGMRPLANELRRGVSEANVRATCLLSRDEKIFLEGRTHSVSANTLRIGATIKSTAERVAFRTTLHVHGNLPTPSIVYLDAARYVPRADIKTVTISSESNPGPSASSPSIPSERHQWTKQQIVNMKFAQLLTQEQGVSDESFQRLWPPVERVLERVRFREITPGLKILFDTPSGPVEFDDLSSGEKSVILLFTELLIRRVSEAAILIDEIELHLHPTWQATILGALRAMLPDCQFVVTTQSPLVAASVQNAKYIFKMGDI